MRFGSPCCLFAPSRWLRPLGLADLVAFLHWLQALGVAEVGDMVCLPLVVGTHSCAGCVLLVYQSLFVIWRWLHALGSVEVGGCGSALSGCWNALSRWLCVLGLTDFGG